MNYLVRYQCNALIYFSYEVDASSEEEALKKFHECNLEECIDNIEYGAGGLPTVFKQLK